MDENRFVGTFVPGVVAGVLLAALVLGTFVGCAVSESLAVDAGCSPSTVEGRLACTVVGGIFQRKVLEETRPGASDGGWAACTQVTCPFEYDRTGRTETRCSVDVFEQCVWELESAANDCAGYQRVMAECSSRAAGSCR